MKEICFVIPCKNSEYTNKMAINCINSIINIYPDADIHVVDSDSDLRQPLRDISLSKKNVYYHEIDNKNYSTGALWYIFDKHGLNYKNYFLLHDSTELLRDLGDISTINLASVCYETDWDWPSSTAIIKNQTKQDRSSLFVENECKKHNLDFFEDFTTILGPMFLIKSKLLQEIKNTPFYEVRPSNKYESECMERFWAMQFCKMGYEEEIIQNSILGKIPDKYIVEDSAGFKTKRKSLIHMNFLGVKVKRKHKIDEDKMVKYWVKRS